MDEQTKQALKAFHIDVDNLSDDELKTYPQSIEEIYEAQQYNVLLELGFINKS